MLTSSSFANLLARRDAGSLDALQPSLSPLRGYSEAGMCFRGQEGAVRLCRPGEVKSAEVVASFFYPFRVGMDNDIARRKLHTDQILYFI